MVNIKEYSLTKIKHWFAKIFTGDDILTIYICSERERKRERERERECVCVSRDSPYCRTNHEGENCKYCKDSTRNGVQQTGKQIAPDK